jgi:hypothetical protein
MGGEFVVTIRLLVATTIFSETVDGHVQYDERYFLFLLSDQLRRAASVYAMQLGATTLLDRHSHDRFSASDPVDGVPKGAAAGVPKR